MWQLEAHDGWNHLVDIIKSTAPSIEWLMMWMGGARLVRVIVVMDSRLDVLHHVRTSIGATMTSTVMVRAPVLGTTRR